MSFFFFFLLFLILYRLLPSFFATSCFFSFPLYFSLRPLFHSSTICTLLLFLLLLPQLFFYPFFFPSLTPSASPIFHPLFNNLTLLFLFSSLLKSPISFPHFSLPSRIFLHSHHRHPTTHPNSFFSNHPTNTLKAVQFLSTGSMSSGNTIFETPLYFTFPLVPSNSMNACRPGRVFAEDILPACVSRTPHLKANNIATCSR